MLSPAPSSSLTVVDVGNSRIKFGAFEFPLPAVGLPEPVRTLSVAAGETDFAGLEAWLIDRPDCASRWLIASVNRDATARLTAALHARGIRQTASTEPSLTEPGLTIVPGYYRLLTHDDLPIKARVENPQAVGIDRLLGAMAANRLRHPDEPAIVISVGSAIVVNFIDRFGELHGGAILPGIGMAARALHDFTDQLPLIPMDELLDPPPALGTSTLAAMRSGLYHGAIGAMRYLVEKITSELGPSRHPPRVFLTGGAAPIVAGLLGPKTMHVPHLVLGALAILAGQNEK